MFYRSSVETPQFHISFYFLFCIYTKKSEAKDDQTAVAIIHIFDSFPNLRIVVVQTTPCCYTEPEFELSFDNIKVFIFNLETNTERAAYNPILKCLEVYIRKIMLTFPVY